MVKVTRVAPKLVHNRGLSLSMTGGAGGAVYIPYLVQHHTAWSTRKGMLTFSGLRAWSTAGLFQYAVLIWTMAR